MKIHSLQLADVANLAEMLHPFAPALCAEDPQSSAARLHKLRADFITGAGSTALVITGETGELKSLEAMLKMRATLARGDVGALAGIMQRAKQQQEKAE